MGFQKQVNVMPAQGVTGDFASVNPVVSTAITYMASGVVYIGRFVWEDGTKPGFVKNEGSGKPLGFAVRNMVYTNYNLRAGSQMFANDGDNINVEVEGDFKIIVEDAVTKGQKVFASTTNGKVKGGSAGASIDGYVETDFAFINSADEGEVAVMSNWGATPAVSSSGTTYTAGTGIKIEDGVIAIDLEAGDGIGISGKVITNTKPAQE